jgi:hypothetical protein
MTLGAEMQHDEVYVSGGHVSSRVGIDRGAERFDAIRFQQFQQSGANAEYDCSDVTTIFWIGRK